MLEFKDTPKCFNPRVFVIPGTLFHVEGREEGEHFPKKAIAQCVPLEDVMGCGVRWIGGRDGNKFKGYCPKLRDVLTVFASDDTMEEIRKKLEIEGITELSFC